MNRVIIAFFVALIGFIGLPTQIQAQPVQQRTLPHDGYFATFNDFYQGEFSRAAKNFRSSARGGFIGVNGPWVDAVCYHTMVGECALQTGDVTVALEQYESAIKVFAANGAWLSRVEFPDTIAADQNAVNRSEINWGTTTRDTTLGKFPTSINVLIGNLEGIERGGVVQRPQLRPANIVEIMRCMSLAMRRRLEILGPAGSYDAVTRTGIDALNASGLPGNHWARPWVDIPVALGMIAEGNEERAAIMLQNAIQIAGQFDHPMSGIAMLELGKLYYKAERFDEAAQLFFEASLSAGMFGHQDVIEESLHWGTKTHLAKKNGGEYPPLANALAWAQRDGSKQLIASLAISLAECRLAAGDGAAATEYLSPVRRTMSRNEISNSPIGARYHFQLAHAAFQSGNVAGGVSDLAKAMQLQSVHSRWLLHINLTDQLYVSGAIPVRAATEMFNDLLREPTDKDWVMSPMDSMSILLIPHPVPMEHWFEMAFERDDHEQAIEISERIRRQRFYNSLPLGGRVLALRWMLEAPREAISQEALAQRQDFFLRYPEYAELANQSKTAVDQLRTLPLKPEDNDEARVAQRKLFDQLEQISGVQEALLADIALRREPSEFEFPPLRPTGLIKERLSEKQGIIAFFSTSNALYQFRLTKTSYAMDRIDRPQNIRSGIVQLLRSLGNMERNAPLDEDVFEDESWREHALGLTEKLFPNLEVGSLDVIDELIIVPDGVLWYLPFELLQIGDETASESLVDKVNVRYLPTVGLTVPDGRRNPAKANLAVVTGKLYPRDEDVVAQEAFEQIKSDAPEAVQLTQTLPGPGALLGVIVDRMLVLDDIEDGRGGTLSIAPMQLDQGKAGSDVTSWMALPFGSVEQILLPGMHTPAESSLRQRNTDGSDMFLLTCGLMASGTRTALISRWRPGGQSSMELMREFLRELPNETATKAWRRSLDLSWRGDIIPELEPRLKESAAEAEISSSHPFFWSGYMLLDTGVEPVK